ncbi:hypothetical protein V8F33_009831 [Rhypophila sp. PSN 637]
MYTPNHKAEEKLLNRRREMEERLGTWSAAGTFRSRNHKLYLWPTTPQLIEWAKGATAANRPGAFSRERLSRAGRSGLDAQVGGLRPDGMAVGGRARALSAHSSSSAGTADSNRTRQSRGALSHRAARGLRATLWPQVEQEVRWLQANFENDMRVTRMDFAEQYNKMQNGLLNVSDQVTGLQRAVEEYTARVGGGYGGGAPGDALGGDRLSIPGQSTRTPSPRMPGRYPPTASDSTRTPSSSPELSRARPAHSPAPPTGTRRLDPRRATVEPEEDAAEEDAASGSKNGRRPSDYYQTAAEEWEERRTLMSNAQQRNPFRDLDQPPSPPTPRPENVVYPRLPKINVQRPSPHDREDHAMSGTQGGREHVVSGGLGLHVPMPKEDRDCWYYWPREAKPPPPRPPKEPLTGQGPPKLPLTPEESGSSTPAEEEQTPEERIIACYNGLRQAVWRFCESSRLINLGPCKNGLHQNIMGTRQFPFETSFPDVKAEGARHHIMLPLPAVDPERWNDYSKDQRWWIIWSGIAEILWDMVLSDRGMKEILYGRRNNWQEYCALVTDSIYYSLKPVWNQWVLDDENKVRRIKEEIWEMVEVAHWLKWLTKNLDGDGDGQEATTKERFVLFVPEADFVERLEEWKNIFQLRGELDGMQDSMGEKTRFLRQLLHTTEELNLITGNPLYMFAFPALLKGIASQNTLTWSDERVLERGWPEPFPSLLLLLLPLLLLRKPDWEEVGRAVEQREAEDEARGAEARERELGRQKEMAKRVADAVESEKRKKEKERRKREEKELEKQEREEALARRQREERAAEVKREIKKGKKKEKKAKQKTVAQIASENAARQRRNSTYSTPVLSLCVQYAVALRSITTASVQSVTMTSPCQTIREIYGWFPASGKPWNCAVITHGMDYWYLTTPPDMLS